MESKALQKKILEELGLRMLRRQLSRRKNPDGTLCYKDFLDRMDKKRNEIIPVRYINPNGD